MPSNSDMPRSAMATISEMYTFEVRDVGGDLALKTAASNFNDVKICRKQVCVGSRTRYIPWPILTIFR